MVLLKLADAYVRYNKFKEIRDCLCFSFDSEFNGPECLTDILLSDHSFVHSFIKHLLSASYFTRWPRIQWVRKKFFKPRIHKVERKPRLLKLCHSSYPRSLSCPPSSLYFSESSCVCFINHV